MSKDTEAYLSYSKVVPKPVGNQIVVELVDETALENGIYIPGKGKVDSMAVTRTFTIVDMGSDVGNVPYGTGDKVFIDYIPNMHPICAEGEKSKDRTIYFILVTAAHVKAVWGK